MNGLWVDSCWTPLFLTFTTTTPTFTPSFALFVTEDLVTVLEREWLRRLLIPGKSFLHNYSLPHPPSSSTLSLLELSPTPQGTVLTAGALQSPMDIMPHSKSPQGCMTAAFSISSLAMRVRKKELVMLILPQIFAPAQYWRTSSGRGSGVRSLTVLALSLR